MSAIQIKYPALTIKAGKRARAHIQKHGLQPADVSTIPGAAGGPKGLGLQGLDIALFGDWLPRTPRPRTLIGASVGAWRFASLCLPDPVEGIKRLGDLYTALRFRKGSSLEEVTQTCKQMLDELLCDEDAAILNNPHYRLNIMAVKSLGLLQHDHKALLGLGLSSVVSKNLLSRAYLGKHFERVILHDPRQNPPLDVLSDFKSHCLPLNQQNLRHALLASGSIPMVMQGVRNIPGAAEGTYRDGGLLDYHLALPYKPNGIVLYPHFTNRIVPGWFDKMVPWRSSDRSLLQDVLLISPSREYLNSLPNRKLPDRSDFKRYLGDDTARERCWSQSINESQRLGDAFLELVENNKLPELMQEL